MRHFRNALEQKGTKETKVWHHELHQSGRMRLSPTLARVRAFRATRPRSGEPRLPGHLLPPYDMH